MTTKCPFVHILTCILTNIHTHIQCEEEITGGGYSKNRRQFSKILGKSFKILLSFENWVKFYPTPPLGRTNTVLTVPWTQGCAMQSLAALALTGTKCIKNKQTNFLLYKLDDWISISTASTGTFAFYWIRVICTGTEVQFTAVYVTRGKQFITPRVCKRNNNMSQPNCLLVGDWKGLAIFSVLDKINKNCDIFCFQGRSCLIFYIFTSNYSNEHI
jgi:hypothetical protein